MKKYLLAIATTAVLLGIMTWIVVAYSVWYANTKPVTHTPTAVEQGAAALHTQLATAEQRETEIEKLYWNAPDKLTVLIDAHQQRIEKLRGNPTAGEIFVHDQQAIAKLQGRIGTLYAEQKARAAAAAAAAERAAEEANDSSDNATTTPAAQQ